MMVVGRRQLGAAFGLWAISTAFLPVSGWAKDDPANGGDKKAPPPKVTIAVIGDSLADGLWGAIYRKLYRDKHVIVYRGAKNSVGFGASDLLDMLDRAFEGPVDAVVMMIGANDRRGIYGSDGKLAAAYHSPQWPAVYRARVDRFMDSATNHGVPLVWVLLPVMRDDGADSDGRQVNSIICEAADDRPLVATLPTRPLTVDADGKYSAYLKDAKGQQRLVRDTDGIHFADHGYDMIADRILAKLDDLSVKIGIQTSAAQ
jgi:hypothetical protein